MYSLLRTKHSLLLGVKRLTKTAKRRLHKLVLWLLLHVVPIKDYIQVNPDNEIIVNVIKSLLFNWVILHIMCCVGSSVCVLTCLLVYLENISKMNTGDPP